MAVGTKQLKDWFTAPKNASRRARLFGQLKLAVVVAGLASVYGYMVHSRQLFPFGLIQQIQLGKNRVEEMLGWRLEWYYQKVGDLPLVKSYQPAKIAPGLTLVSGLGPEDHPEARVIDARGQVIQRWSIDWFRLWPDAKHLPSYAQFDGPPGPHIHGILLEDNGDLVFSLERAGLFRLDACGKVKWKLPKLTHHSLFRDEDGNLWTGAVDWSEIKDPNLPGYKGVTQDYRILKVSPQGKILGEWRIADLLLANGLESSLYMVSQANIDPVFTGDVLHANDVDVFPRSMAPGIFKPGDVMVSIRNINTIFVFDLQTGKLVHTFSGPFVRQHDPNFVDGNTIRVFDNYSQTSGTSQERSRILELYADGRPPRILFEGTRQHPFFTTIMGKQQSLPNGNLLLTEAVKGRALEVDAQGQPVWEYRNFYKKGVSALMDEAQRLDPAKDAKFFAQARARCGA